MKANIYGSASELLGNVFSAVVRLCHETPDFEKSVSEMPNSWKLLKIHKFVNFQLQISCLASVMSFSKLYRVA